MASPPESPRLPPRWRRLQPRLLAAYLVPALLVLGLFGLGAYRVTRQSLERSLGRRLVSIAQAVAATTSAEAVTFLAPGDDDTRTARRLHRKLARLVARTGVARILIVDRQRRARADSAGRLRVGDRHYQAEADRAELRRVFARRAGVASVLFAGRDGRMYMTGYAPILGDEGGAVAAVAVLGSARYFATLARLQRYLLASGAASAALVLLVTALLARRITRPLSALARAAERIGRGQLEDPVTATSRDELGLLARTMNEMRARLKARDEELQLMLAGIAHEVRNPLGGLSLFAGLLAESVGDDPERGPLVARIRREVAQLQRVVEDFLAYARRRELARGPVDLGDLAAEAVELARPAAEAAGVTVALHREPAPALADGERLRQALLNVLQNAVQACEPGGHVTVRAGRDPRGAPFVEVADDGAGIPAENLERVFAPFFTTREKGTGLGLALARRAVEEHGGRIHLASVPGRGTTVRVTLAAEEEHG